MLFTVAGTLKRITKVTCGQQAVRKPNVWLHMNECVEVIFLVVWSLTGDLPYLAEEYGLPHCNSNEFCWMCRADRMARSFTDVSADAAWKATLLDVHAPHPRVSGHPVWDIVGIDRWHAPGDLMHTGCLGILLWLQGAVLWELQYDGPFHGTVERRRRALWELVCAKYDELDVPANTRLADLDVARFHSVHGFAELRAKAAESRHLLPVLTAVCMHVNTGSPRDRHRVAALKHVSAVYALVQDSDYIIPDNVHSAMKDHTNKFFLHYNWLAKNSAERLHLCYHFTSKFHYFWHLIEMAQWLNPKATWCYEYEHFVGLIIRCARACVASTRMSLVGVKVADNAVLALHCDLVRMSQEKLD